MTRNNRQSRKDMTDRQRIDAFLSCVDELKERSFILDGLYNFRFHISIDEKSGEITCEFHEGNEELLITFLVTFRKFLLINEPSNIDRVLNICRRFVREDEKELKEVLNEFKTVWGYRYRKGVSQMSTSGLNLTPEYVLDLWINGKYFHGDDPSKQKRLRNLLAQEVPSVKIQLLWSLPLLTDIILQVGYVVSKAIKSGAFEFPVDDS